MTNLARTNADAERHIQQWLESYRLMRCAVQMVALRRLADEAPLLAVAGLQPERAEGGRDE